jgi:hypothetical protein
MGRSLKPFLLIHLLFLTLIPLLHAMSTDDNPIQDEGHFPRYVHANKKHIASTKQDIIVTTQRPALVLALDGGGMRGLVTTEVLQHMENDWSEN